MRQVKRVAKIQLARTALAMMITALPLNVSAAGQNNDTLTIGYQKGSGLLTALKAQRTLEERLEPAGITVRWHEFAAGPQLLEALNAGSIDVGQTGAPPAVFAQAAGADLVYVGAEPNAEETEAIITAADSDVRDIAELKGRKVALQKGSSAHYLLVRTLQRAGLSLSDIQPVWLPPADARAAFVTGRVDAWAIWDPYLAAIEAQDDVRRLADYHGLEPTHSFYEASKAFAEQHPQTLVAVREALAETGEWANTHKGDMAKLLSTQLGLPESVVARWLDRNHYGISPMSDEVVHRQQQVADTFRSQGLIPRDVDVASAVWQAPEQASFTNISNAAP